MKTVLFFVEPANIPLCFFISHNIFTSHSLSSSLDLFLPKLFSVVHLGHMNQRIIRGKEPVALLIARNDGRGRQKVSCLTKTQSVFNKSKFLLESKNVLNLGKTLFQVKNSTIFVRSTPRPPPPALPATTPFLSGEDARVRTGETAASTGGCCRLALQSCIT